MSVEISYFKIEILYLTLATKRVLSHSLKAVSLDELESKMTRRVVSMWTVAQVEQSTSPLHTGDHRPAG